MVGTAVARHHIERALPRHAPGVQRTSSKPLGGLRMSTDLSPAEQARAARWAANWLASEAYVGGTAIVELREHADKLDPPETVESLRAERDAALADRMDFQRERYRIAAALDTQTQELDAAMADVTHWREQFRLVCDESEDRKNDLVRLRSTHAEAEAAWERCKRQPRVWHTGDPEPEGVTRVRDREGDEWVKGDDGGWGSRMHFTTISDDYGPLTEVLDED